MTDRHKGLFLNVELVLCLLEVVLRLVESFKAEGEGTPVHPNWFLAFDIQVDSNRLLRVDVLRRQELSGLVGPNRQNGEIKRPILVSNFFENLCIGSISWVEYLLIIRSLDNESSPQPLVEIKGRSARPMAHRHKCHFICFIVDLYLFFIHPIHFHHIRIFREHILRSEASNKAGLI